MECTVVGDDPARPKPLAMPGALAHSGSPNPWATFSLVAIGTFMTMLGASLVNITDTFPLEKRGFALGCNAVVVSHKP